MLRGGANTGRGGAAAARDGGGGDTGDGGEGRGHQQLRQTHRTDRAHPRGTMEQPGWPRGLLSSLRSGAAWPLCTRPIGSPTGSQQVRGVAVARRQANTPNEPHLQPHQQHPPPPISYGCSITSSCPPTLRHRRSLSSLSPMPPAASPLLTGGMWGLMAECRRGSRCPTSACSRCASPRPHRSTVVPTVSPPPAHATVNTHRRGLLHSLTRRRADNTTGGASDGGG